MNVLRSFTTVLALLAITFGFAVEAFPEGDRLTIDPGLADQYGVGTPIGGSFFNVGPYILLSPGTDGGILEGVPQAPGQIDAPWWFAGYLGNLFSTGSGLTRSDFSNLAAAWGPLPEIWLGTPATVPTPSAPFHPNPQSLDFDLNGSVSGLEFQDNGDGTYFLNYGAIVPAGDPSGFGGLQVFVHLEGFLEPGPPGPGIRVSIVVDGGLTQECSAEGGSAVPMTAVVTLLGDAELGTITWTVDEADAGTGEVIEPFIDLGDHTVMVTAATTTGETDTATIPLTVKDTTRPVIDVAFIDSRSGEQITQIERANVQWVIASYPATDICDPAPVTAGVGGFAVTDGALLKIQGNNDTVMLITSEITLSATATDSSGNTSSGYATLTLMP